MKNGNLKNTIKPAKHMEWQHFRSRLNYNRIIIVLVILLCILTTAMLYLLLVEKPEVCTTSTCVRTSMKLLDYIDSTVDPCQDFYLFSCGNFLQTADQKNDVPHSTEAVAQKDIQDNIKYMLEGPIQVEDRLAFQKAKQFYRACMNETQIDMEGLAWIRSVFKYIGGWPTLKGHHWKDSQFYWQDVMHDLRKIGVNAELFISVTVDKSRNKMHHLLGIHGVPYSPSTIDKNTRTMYLEYMVDVAQIFGADKNIARKDSSELIDLHLKLAKEYEKSVKENQTGLYDLYSLSELQHRFPRVSWKNYINNILLQAEQITDDDTVVVGEPLYLDAVIRILRITSRRTLANFIAWHTLQQLINFLPVKILDRSYEYLEKLYGKMITKEPRWTTCIQATRERMDSVVSAAYIEHFFTQNSRRDVEEMIRDIKVQLKMNLYNKYDLDDEVIEHYLNNVVDIGSHSDLMEIHLENEAYNNVEVYEDKLLQSVLNLDFISLNMKFGKLRKPVNGNWLGESSFVTGLDVYYSVKENVMRFPQGIFSGMYYQYDRPKYMNYGSVGSIIAQEIWQLLMKADLDSSGASRSLSSMEFGAVDSTYSLDKETKRLILSDMNGIKVAYNSYSIQVQQNGIEPRLPGLPYSPYQLFWISSAIRHCTKYSSTILEGFPDNCNWSLPQFRVNGPLQYLDDFARDFGCPAESGMKPENNCFVW